MTMQTASKTSRLADVLAADPGVVPGYRHYPKRAAPRKPLELPTAVLKWYDLHAEDSPVPDAITQMARAHLADTPLEASGLGFVLLHRCGRDFYFLIVCTWRNENELWETVFYKDGDAMAEFALFPRNGVHKPTFCVWELVPAWHEKQAWVRFLSSNRDDAGAQAWLADSFDGPAL